uniref:CUB_2 domain-containing protein n=1 Tax=Caenorhabditis tropicalis TaxID=1561998 RepID=A0A1I7UW82_9PELO
MIHQLLVALLMVSTISAQDFISFGVNETATIPLPQSPTYRRTIYLPQEHIYRVCNGKNANTCGFWENTANKKKVKSGETSYNTDKKKLTIKQIMVSDYGTYMTGDKKTSIVVFQSWDYIYKPTQ